MPAAELKSSFEAHGQGQVFRFHSQLSPNQQAQLQQQLSEIDPARANSIFKKSVDEAKKRETGVAKPKMEPLPTHCFQSLDQASAQQLNEWRSLALDAIANGKVAVVLLAGGQGSRLGSSAPKGCYDIGLPSHKSLFQIQAERIVRLQSMASSQSKKAIIPWYVMTSGPTRAATEQFFIDSRFFGLSQSHVKFFDQGVLPAFFPDGKIILENKDFVSVAPDGNGGVYAALRTHGILDDMKHRGVEYVHVYCVDNCLVRVADPLFIGFCMSKKSRCAAKVVKKTVPSEPVGVVCLVNGKYGVVEYSEISKEDSERKTADDRLVYDAANIANHFYTREFLETVCSREFEDQMEYHIANKKIKYVDDDGNVITPTKSNGIKLELFIFDIFPFLSVGAKNNGSESDFAVLSVPREQEFSPLKNAPGAGVDCPETSRRDLYKQSYRFLVNAGAKINVQGGEETICNEKVPVIEISPLVSYDGENLSDAVAGKTLTISAPVKVESLADLKAILS